MNYDYPIVTKRGKTLLCDNDIVDLVRSKFDEVYGDDLAEILEKRFERLADLELEESINLI